MSCCCKNAVDGRKNNTGRDEKKTIRIDEKYQCYKVNEMGFESVMNNDELREFVICYGGWKRMYETTDCSLAKGILTTHVIFRYQCFCLMYNAQTTCDCVKEPFGDMHLVFLDGVPINRFLCFYEKKTCTD